METVKIDPLMCKKHKQLIHQRKNKCDNAMSTSYPHSFTVEKEEHPCPQKSSLVAEDMLQKAKIKDSNTISSSVYHVPCFKFEGMFIFKNEV